MQPIKAIIADDEPELRRYLRSALQEAWPDLDVCAEADNGPQALALIEKHRPRIAFLDIRMPGLSGMEVAKKIEADCRVVFVTAYDQYALEAFEAEAVDYLLKPVEADRLTQTVERLKREMTSDPSPGRPLPENILRAINRIAGNQPPRYLQWIRAQHRDSLQLIPTAEVCFFQARDKYTAVVTREGEFLIRKSIKALAKDLDPDTFWQIHRGTLVNVGFIDKVSRSLTGRCILKLKDLSETLTVSRSYAHLFKQM
jgi:DNA-binding LytR/AlgR family response regulator